MPTLITKYASAVTDATGLLKLDEVKFVLTQVNGNISGRLRMNMFFREGTMTFSLAGGSSTIETIQNGEWATYGTSISIPSSVQDLSQAFRIRVIGTSTLTVAGANMSKWWGMDNSFAALQNNTTLFQKDNYGANNPLIVLDYDKMFIKLNTLSFNGTSVQNINKWKSSRLEVFITDNVPIITDTITQTNFPNLKRLGISGAFKTLNPINSLPAGLKIIQLNNTSATGDFATFKNVTPMEQVAVYGSNITLANLTNLPRAIRISIGLEIFFGGGYGAAFYKNSAYTGGFNWPTGFNSLQLGGFVLNATSMDILLNELAGVTWGGDGRSLILQGQRTSASDAALVQLAEKEVVINITNKAQV